MLRQRVLTALVAAPLVLGVILFAPLDAFALFFLALAGVGAFEWFRLANVARAPLLVAAWLQLVLWVLLFALSRVLGIEPWLLLGVVVWWVVVAPAVVVRYPAPGAWFGAPARHASLGAPVLAAAWYSLVAIRGEDGGVWLLMWMFSIVWAADIGAYFAGRAVGRRKLAPAVSPGKTWEGVWGGLLAAAVTGAVFGAAAPALTARFPWFAWGLLALPLAGVSVVGDLFESALKRDRGVKDSGGLFPGHGGALDRIDSVLAVAPCFALFVVLYGSAAQ